MVQTVEGFQWSEVIFLCSRRRPTYECWISSSKSLDGSICCNNVSYRATALLYWIFFSNKFSVYFWKRLHALINAFCWQKKKGINIFGHSQVELLFDGLPIMNMKWHAQFRYCSARWIIFQFIQEMYSWTHSLISVHIRFFFLILLLSMGTVL